MPRLYSLKMIIYLLFLALPLLTAGCDNPAPTSPPAGPRKEAPALVMHIGLIPELNLFDQKKHYQPLMDYLSLETGIRFELHVLPHNGNLIDYFNKLGLDGAFFGSFSGALAIKKLGIIPLVKPEFIGGSSSYYGLVFVRRNSGINTATDMKGKRMAFVDRATMAGYLYPLAYFRQLGITNYSEWFGEYYFSGSDEDAILDVFNGTADIGAAKSTIFNQLAAKNQRLEKDLEILTISPPIAAGGLIVRKDMPEKLRDLIQDKLLTMEQSMGGQAVLKEFGAEKFLPASVEDYQPVLDYATSIGLDLSTYSY